MTTDDLKQWRERLGITQEEAANLLGVSRPTIARYETDQEIPLAIDYACRYLEALSLYRKSKAMSEDNRYPFKGLHEALLKAKESILGITKDEISVSPHSTIDQALSDWLSVRL